MRVFLILWFLTFSSFASIIGDVILHEGNAVIERTDGEDVDSKVDLDIFSYDTIKTGKGKVAIEFIDETRVDVTQHSKLIIDEFVYDPNTKTGSLSLKSVLGTVRYASGQIAKTSPTSVQIKTPTATIGVRGTDFTTSVDELGRSLVILLPDAECNYGGSCIPSGEITVTNDGGTVTLSEAFQATMVSSISTPPVQPVRLDNIMNLNTIDNMFIVSPPEKIVDAQAEESSGSSSSGNGILDFSDLDIDYLKEDWDDEDENLEFTELDMDLLDVDFLQDVLVTIEEVNILKRSTRSNNSAEGGIIEGTSVGFDKESQYNTIIDQSMGQIWFYRDVNGVIDIRVPIEQGTRIESENEGKTNLILVNDGESVVIIIKQSGG